MKIPTWLLSIALVALVSLQAWTLKTVNTLQVDVAKLTQHVNDIFPQSPVQLSTLNPK